MLGKKNEDSRHQFNPVLHPQLLHTDTPPPLQHTRQSQESTADEKLLNPELPSIRQTCGIVSVSSRDQATKASSATEQRSALTQKSQLPSCKSHSWVQHLYQLSHSLPSLKHTGITQTWEQFSMSFVNTSLYQQAAGCRSCRKGLCPEVCILQYSHISLHPSPTREEPDTNPQILLYPNTSLLSLAFIQQSLSVPIQSPCIQFTTEPKLQTELTVCPCPTAHRGQVKLQGQSSSHQEIQQSTKAH